MSEGTSSLLPVYHLSNGKQYLVTTTKTQEDTLFSPRAGRLRTPPPTNGADNCPNLIHRRRLLPINSQDPPHKPIVASVTRAVAEDRAGSQESVGEKKERERGIWGSSPACEGRPKKTPPWLPPRRRRLSGRGGGGDRSRRGGRAAVRISARGRGAARRANQREDGAERSREERLRVVGCRCVGEGETSGLGGRLIGCGCGCGHRAKPVCHTVPPIRLLRIC